MAILVWLFIGLAAGASANRIAGKGHARIARELAVGLIGSLLGGLAFLLLK